MFKYVGAALIFAACTSEGMFLAYRLARRAETLKKCLEFLETVMVDVKYSMEPVYELFEYLCAGGRYETLLFPRLCYEQMENGTPFPKALRGAVEQSRRRLELTAVDAELLSSLGDILGSTDAEGQQLLLEGRRAELKQLYEEAQRQSEKLGKLWRTSGVLAGAAALVLIL